MKNLWIVANWKSNKTVAEALEWVEIVGSKVEKKDNLKVVVCPTFDVIPDVKKAILAGQYGMLVGAQDLSPFGVGAYTGEEPALLLKQYVELSILGHSERRQNFGETDEMVAEKVIRAHENGIIPLVCVQGQDALVPKDCRLVAYEPIFAIGTGNPDTPENASKVAENLRQRYGLDIEVLYGGSVTSANAKGFIAQEYINGLLIGKASLDPQEFISILERCRKLWS